MKGGKRKKLKRLVTLPGGAYQQGKKTFLFHRYCETVSRDLKFVM